MKKINVHGHILNYGCCPNKWLLKQAHIPEWVLKRYTTRYVIWFITSLLPGNKFDRTPKMMKMFKNTLFQNADLYYYNEMIPNEIELFTPLLMDMDYATDEEYEAELGYEYIVTIMSEIAEQYFGVIMPFYGFDPRRHNAAIKAIHALDRMGFLGIKMYPKLGFHPWHESNINSRLNNEELGIMYEHCQEEKIPITVHCSPGGAYSESLVGYDEKANLLVCPKAWKNVLKDFPKLKLNFAHFGGNLSSFNSWTEEIIYLMNCYEYVFADTSYHDDAHNKKTRFKYFQNLDKAIAKAPPCRIMGGTDYPMTAHTFTEKEYYSVFEDALETYHGKKFGIMNVLAPIKFLFDEEFPPRILTAFNKSQKDIPQWLNSVIEKYK